uniref:Putative secreted protein n=1 Tax=Ixodes ricinus TaxID=34613 RepID=A0A6B0UI61_IXORI
MPLLLPTLATLWVGRECALHWYQSIENFHFFKRGNMCTPPHIAWRVSDIALPERALSISTQRFILRVSLSYLCMTRLFMSSVLDKLVLVLLETILLGD